jgi:3-methyladenine DNA glycosylase AlkD
MDGTFGAGASTAGELVAALRELASPTELPAIEKRLAPGDSAIGVRMRDLFDTARAATWMPLDEVEKLFASPLYEARMGALCILDFRARAPGTDDAARRRLYDLYLGHHDRITTWDMVDRAAPRVVGGYLVGRPAEPLFALAGAADPLRRRTAATAPLWFVRYGGDADLRTALALAAELVADPEPVVHTAVGILLKHAGGRDPGAVADFVVRHAAALPRPVLRAAVQKLDPDSRVRALGGPSGRTPRPGAGAPPGPR